MVLYVYFINTVNIMDQGRKLKDLKKVAEFLLTNLRVFENFLCEKLLTRQNIRSYVTMGNMLPRQNRTRQNLAEPYTPHSTHSTLFIIHSTL